MWFPVDVLIKLDGGREERNSNYIGQYCDLDCGPCLGDLTSTLPLELSKRTNYRVRTQLIGGHSVDLRLFE